MIFQKKDKKKTKNSNGNGNGHCKKKENIQKKLDKALSEVEEISEEASVIFNELNVKGEASGR